MDNDPGQLFAADPHRKGRQRFVYGNSSERLGKEPRLRALQQEQVDPVQRPGEQRIMQQPREQPLDDGLDGRSTAKQIQESRASMEKGAVLLTSHD
jgi:hypothetical protein